MKIEEFTSQIQKLEKWCKRLTDDQKDLLYEQLKHIPAEAFRNIVNDFIHSLRPGSPFPSINDLKEAWIAWKASHPEKIAKEYKEEFCPECGGKGYFEVVNKVVLSRFGPIEEGEIELKPLTIFFGKKSGFPATIGKS